MTRNRMEGRRDGLPAMKFVHRMLPSFKLRRLFLYVLSTFFLIFAPIILVPMSHALEAPRPGEIDSLRQSGQLDERLEHVKTLGNHKIDQYLVEKALAKVKREALAQQGFDQAMIDMAAPVPAPPPGWKGMPTKGTVKMFALLIDFPDYPAVNTSAKINSALFRDGSLIPGNAYPYESLTAYYERSSYGLLDLSGGVTLGWYRPAYTRASMVQTPAARDNLIKEAITHFRQQGQNFAQFDNDGDGTIEYFAVFWTGPDNGWANFWWGYDTSFTDSSFTIDGKHLNNYSWQWESRGGGAFSPEVIIHETGHALGIPDYYDYNSSVGPDGGVGGLDMMDANWGDHNCFSKWILEWITPSVVATGSRSITLSPSSTAAEAVIVMPGATAQDPFREFFMAQNRNRSGNDTGYPTDGLLIWHVDARLASGYYLYDNSYTDHKLLKLMEADGRERIEGSSAYADAAMYYQPGNSFTPSSIPSSRNYAGSSTGVSISGIAKSAPRMTATFGVAGTAPVANFTADRTAGGVPLSVAFTDTSVGEVTGWQWNFGDSSTSSQRNPTHLYTAVGTYTVSLTVSGPGGSNSVVKTAFIRVTPPPPAVSVSLPANGTVFTAPATVTLTAIATAGSGGTVSRVDFFNGALLLGSDTTSPYTYTWSNVPAGSYALTATVTDSWGQTTTSAPVTIAVMDPALASPWETRDVGAVGVVGAAALSVGPVTVRGSGADIWGNADGFRFVYQQLTGDGQITARVVSVGNTDVSAKAGVMIRETLAADSANAMMAIKPGGGSLFQRRTAAGGSSTFTAGPQIAAPYWVRLVRVGSMLTGYVSADGVSWVLAGSDTLNMGANVYVGVAVSSHNNGALCSAVFDHLSIPPLDAPEPWLTLDIGTVGIRGSVEGAGFEVTGAGDDIWGTADAFHFVYHALSGDGEITARVVSLDNTHESAKAGVMIRDALTSDSSNAILEMTPGNWTVFQRRLQPGELSVYTSGSHFSASPWVRLVRSGTTVTAYHSPDGTNWSLVGSDTLSLSGTVYIGLAVTSHDRSKAASATFDNVTLSGSQLPGQWIHQDIGTVGVAGAADHTGMQFSIDGAGDDIWGTADSFRFVYQQLSGDGEISARVVSLQNRHESTKAGVMMRESLAAGSRNAIMEMTPGNGTIFQTRLATGGVSDYVAGPFVPAPYWVKLVRRGATITGHTSANGQTWSQVASATVPMAQIVYVGLAVTSHVNSLLADAVFDNVAVKRLSPVGDTTPPTTSPSVMMGTYDGPQAITLNCTDGSGSGCASTYYVRCTSSNGVDTCTPLTRYTGQIAIDTSATLRFYSIDAAGNIEVTRAYTYTIDPNLQYRYEQLWPQVPGQYFRQPRKVAVDKAGSVYIAQASAILQVPQISYATRIIKLDSSGRFASQWSPTFTNIKGLTVDGAGNTYVIDNDTIRKLNANGAVIVTWGSSGSSTGQFSNAEGIAVDSDGNIWVADRGNNRIQKFTPGGAFLGAYGSAGSGTGQFNGPNGIAADATGHIYVADAGNRRVQIFDTSGRFLSLWSTNLGQGITAIATGSASSVYVMVGSDIRKFTAGGKFLRSFGGGESADGICVDGAGETIYAASYWENKIRKYASTGALQEMWGASSTSIGRFKDARGVAATGNGAIYVTELERIQKFTSPGTFEWARPGSFGDERSGTLVAVDSSGYVYAHGPFATLNKFDSSGNLLLKKNFYSISHGAPAASIAVDRAGSIYLDAGQIWKSDSNGNLLSTLTLNGGSYNDPTNIAVDSAGNIYAAFTNAVGKFNSTGNFITSWGSAGNGPGQFNNLRGIALDSDDSVYVVDSGNNRIQKFTSSGAFITMWGTYGSGNGQFSAPEGIAVDSGGNVYVTEYDRVQKFSRKIKPPGAPTGVTATAGDGYATVSFTPPASNGGSPITSYTVTSSPGSISATGTASTIRVYGLTNGTSYTFTVTATNIAGPGPASAPSNVVVPHGNPWLSLILGGTGSGTVTISTSQGNYSCIKTASCPPLQLPYNSQVTLMATADSVSVFGGWGGACANGSGNCTLTMNADKSVTSTFTAADRARIGSTGYPSLALAYGAAPLFTSTLIATLDTNLGETLNFNQTKNILLKGGWNSEYSATTGRPTVLHKLSVSKGSVRVRGGVAIR